MTKSYDLPLPNDEFDDAIVVASVWQDDEKGTALLLLMRREPPYYGVADIEWAGGSWMNVFESEFANIVPAVERYQDSGGDY